MRRLATKVFILCYSRIAHPFQNVAYIGGGGGGWKRDRMGSMRRISTQDVETWPSFSRPNNCHPNPHAPLASGGGGDNHNDNRCKLGMVKKKEDILKITDGDLEALVLEWDEKKFRAEQIRRGIAAGRSLLELNIPMVVRRRLEERFTVGSMVLAAEQISKDGTLKRSYELSDGQLIETVLMPYRDGRRTACISSQAGCAMGCTFCATGQMGFSRQLTSDEIFEQAYHMSSLLARRGERLSNVVFMGMGEPLTNYKNVMDAVRRINSKLGIGARHITISTVGVVPRIRQLAELGMQVSLAVSLHASNDRARSKILPVNRRYPLSELISACLFYTQKTNRRITFEWALIEGQNDSPNVAAELGNLLYPLKGLCHVNIIPLNQTPGYGGQPPRSKVIDDFATVLREKYGIPITTRIPRGLDISAGCGQLKADVEKQRGRVGYLICAVAGNEGGRVENSFWYKQR